MRRFGTLAPPRRGPLRNTPRLRRRGPEALAAEPRLPAPAPPSVAPGSARSHRSSAYRPSAARSPATRARASSAKRGRRRHAAAQWRGRRSRAHGSVWARVSGLDPRGTSLLAPSDAAVTCKRFPVLLSASRCPHHGSWQRQFALHWKVQRAIPRAELQLGSPRYVNRSRPHREPTSRGPYGRGGRCIEPEPSLELRTHR